MASGEEKTPKPFVAACKFVYIELLREDSRTSATEEPSPDPSLPADAVKPAAMEKLKKPKSPVGFIAKVLDDSGMLGNRTSSVDLLAL